MLSLLVRAGHSELCARFLEHAHVDQPGEAYTWEFAEAFAMLDAATIARIACARINAEVPDSLVNALFWLEVVLHPALDAVPEIEVACARVIASFTHHLPTSLPDEPRFVYDMNAVVSAWGYTSPLAPTMRLLEALTREEDAAEQSVLLVTKIASHPEVYAMREAIVPALITLCAEGMQDAHPALTALYDATLSWARSCVVAPPSPPGDWSRPFTGCGCQDCEEISAFMSDPQRERMIFPAAKARRRHLHQLLSHHDCSHQTIRQGRPYKLDLVKTSHSYSRAEKLYKSDVKQLAQLLSLA